MPRTRRSGTPVFATTPYEPDEDGVLRAVLPARCVFADPAEESCRLGVRHRRERTTGPCFPLAVVRCATHPLRSFTLYPPGHFPYGRTPILSVSTTGVVLVDGSMRKPVREGTVFDAARDAARGDRWPAGSPAGDLRRRRTQGRHIEVSGELLGVHPGLTARQREQMATGLDVATMTLRTAASKWSTSWTSRSTAITAVLAAIFVDGSVLDRLLGSGHLAGLWPQSRRWDPVGSSWVVGRSLAPERSPETTSPARGPPPTNSPVASLRSGDPPSGP